MRLYCKIVEVGQLSIAAEQLNLSNGAVSKQLSKLEAHLGGRLLSRTTRSLTPTEVGKAYYDRAKQILESVDEAECVVSGLTAEPSGTLKINAPMSFGFLHMAKLLAKYQEMYPKVTVDIDLHDRQIDLVEEGYDLALRIAKHKDSTLIARKLADCKIVMVASPEYLEKYGEPISPKDLKKHKCLMYTYHDSIKSWTLKNTEGIVQQISVTGSLVANNGNLICDALVNGMGIAILPTFIIGDEIRNGRAKIIMSDWNTSEADISLLYPSNKHLSAKVRAFVDLAADHFKPSEEGVNDWDRGLFL